MGVITGVISCFLDTFATCMSIISLYSVGDIANLAFSSDPNYMSSFVQNGIFWKIIAYSSAMGGNILLIGSVSGLALMKMEHIHIGWYFKKVGVVAMAAWLLGLFIMWILS